MTQEPCRRRALWAQRQAQAEPGAVSVPAQSPDSEPEKKRGGWPKGKPRKPHAEDE